MIASSDRLLITGSRDWTDAPLIYSLIYSINAFHGKMILVSGNCPTGADRLCEDAAISLNWTLELHPPNWDSCGPSCNPSHWRYRQNGDHYCPRSGFVRNHLMVQRGAVQCLAFIKNASKGATMTADLAERAGIPVKRYLDPAEV